MGIRGTSVRGKKPKCGKKKKSDPAKGRLSKCQKKRQNASRIKMIGAFKPKCNADGSYAKVQCHASTGYCWCSTKKGKKIPGTSVRGKKTKCGSKKRKSDPAKGRLSRCQRHRKKVHRLGAFKPRCNADGTYAKVQCNPSSGYCWCATKKGKTIRGTSVRGKKPKCGKKRKSDPAKGRLSKCQKKRKKVHRLGAFKPRCNA